MVTSVQEAVKVLAAFDSQGMQARPMQMVWHGRGYTLGPVDFLHVTKKGSERVYHFSLSDKAGGAYFKLAFYSHTLRWFLEEVDDGTWD